MTTKLIEQNPFYVDKSYNSPLYKAFRDPSVSLPSFVQEKITLAISAILYIGARNIDNLNPRLGAFIRFVVIILIIQPIVNIYHYVAGGANRSLNSRSHFNGKFDNTLFLS